MLSKHLGQRLAVHKEYTQDLQKEQKKVLNMKVIKDLNYYQDYLAYLSVQMSGTSVNVLSGLAWLHAGSASKHNRAAGTTLGLLKCNHIHLTYLITLINTFIFCFQDIDITIRFLFAMGFWQKCSI